MTQREWALFVAELESTFRGDLAEDREAALQTHLAHFPYDACRGAVRRLVVTGQSWQPTAAELVAALRREVGERNVRAWLAGCATPEEYEGRVLRAALDAPKLRELRPGE